MIDLSHWNDGPLGVCSCSDCHGEWPCHWEAWISGPIPARCNECGHSASVGWALHGSEWSDLAS